MKTKVQKYCFTTPKPRRRRSPVPVNEEKNPLFFTNSHNIGTALHYPEYIAKTDNTRRDTFSPDIQAPVKGAQPRPTFDIPGRPTNISGAETLTPGQLYRRNIEFNNMPACSNLFLAGSCTAGAHRHIKAIVCGKEWCRDCGRLDSIVHRRRMARWHAKVHSMEKVGYLVITIPIELRKFYNTKEALTEFRTYIRRKLQRTNIAGKSELIETPYNYTTKAGKKRIGTRRDYKGYLNGLIRWHYAGDCKKCKGEGCEYCRFTGAGDEWHPHLNILIQEGYINKRILNNFRDDITEYFKKRFPSYRSKGNIHYQFKRKEGEKSHVLRYVTRATQRKYHPEICKMLKGFHTSSSWGKWKKENQSIPQDNTEACERGMCLHCLHDTGELSKINWAPEKMTRAEAAQVISLFYHYGDGYYSRNTDIDILN
jgi:hypothetical protein